MGARTRLLEADEHALAIGNLDARYIDTHIGNRPFKP